MKKLKEIREDEISKKNKIDLENLHIKRIKLYQLDSSSFTAFCSGRGDTDRTCDLMVPNHALYQLSHTPSYNLVF